MNRSAKVYKKNVYCGVLSENENGYQFQYDSEYVKNIKGQAISLTMPMRVEAYESKTLFAFFDGLIPEGWLLDIAEKNWKLNHRDRMGLLLYCCKDCIGDISILKNEEL